MSQIIAEYKFNNILYDLIPEFNEGFEYTYEDILEGNVTTRTIYSNELPTLLRFGNSDTSGETGDSNKYNSLLEVLYLASSEITYAGLMFHRCANVSYICPFILTNKNNSLHGIFSGCHSLTSLDVSNFDTSNVTDMSYAFYTNNLIELDLSDWDTHNVTNMNHILYSCQNLKTLNISNWNLNNVTNMGWFVNQCNNLNEIIMNDSDYNSINKIVSELLITNNGSECNFCISGVDDISKVNIREGWDIMSTITSNAICNPSSISVTGKTNGSGTISWSLPSIPTEATITSCKLTGTCTITDSSNRPATVTVNRTSVSSGVAFTINLGTGNTTSSVAVAATGPHKNTKSTITFSNLVYTVDYEINVTYSVTFKDWDGTILKTETVKEGSSAIAPANPTRDGYEFTGWDKDFSNITSDLILTAQYKEVVRHLVVRYTAKTSGVSLNFNDNYDHVITETESNGIYTVEVYSTQDLNRFIFRDEPNLLTIEYLKITNKITDMSDMFYNCTSLEYVNTDGWDTSNVTLMRNTFQNCSSLVSVDVSSFDVRKVTLMDFMFDECESLVSLDVSNWNTNSLTNANYIFNNCDKLKQLDLSSWNVDNMEYMNYMFSEEAALNQIDISNWKIPSTAYLNNIFRFSYNLRTIIMNNSDYNSVNMIIEKLINASEERPGTLNIKGIDDISQVNIATAESKYWNVVLDEESKPIYTVTFKDWDETILKIENVEEGNSATPPANPTRDGYTFTGWDVDFYNITSNLIITAQYKKESEEDIIEWTGIGTVESDLFAYAQPHSNYKINLDWENEYFDVIIKEELNFDWRYMNDAYIGNIVIGDCSYTISYGDGYTGLYNENDEYIGGSSNISEDDQYGLPQTMRFTKDGIYLIVESTPYLLTERPYEINQPIYIYEDNEVNNGVNGNYDLKFDLVVSERPNEEPEEDVIEWTGLGTVATNLSTKDNWTYKLNIDWDTQYVEINNIVAGVAAFNHGANVLYLNNEYDLSTGDLIYCDETTMLVIDSKNDYEFDFYADEFFIKISKDNGFTLTNYYDNESFTIENYPIIENSSTLYLSSLVCLETGHSTIGEIKVVALEEPEEPDDNDLIQGDINDESGTFEDEVSNVVKTKYIDVSDKKQILVNVLTEDVYILKCYLYNANKELVKIIDISADKKRMFGLDLQKLIEEVMNDGNE